VALKNSPLLRDKRHKIKTAYTLFRMKSSRKDKTFIERLVDLLSKQRKYASHFEWHDKRKKELGVVECLIDSMKLRGEKWLHSPQSSKIDPPDCIAKDSEGKNIGIEVSELVDVDAIWMNQKGKQVYRDWRPEEVIKAIQKIIDEKDVKQFKGDPYNNIVLLIFTDEVTISYKEYSEILEPHIFETPKKIGTVYFLFSYNPDPCIQSYPYLKLNIGK
jgi:hypothetical protein